MKQTYLQNHIKNNPKLLPYIKTKRTKPTDSTLNHLKQPTQQSILLQIQDIDQSLHHKNYYYRHGNLFSNQITDKAVQQLHSLITKNQAAIVEDGFSLGKIQKGNRSQSQININQKRLSSKMQTLNQKLVKLSLKNVYEYDLRKYMQIMKHNRNRWSLFKRVNNQQSQSVHNAQQNSQIVTAKKLQQTMKKQLNQIKQSSYGTSSVFKNNSPSKSNHSEQTTLSPASKLSQLLESKNISRAVLKNKQKSSKKFNRKVLTQISQITNPEDQNQQISKYNIKSMLKKQTNPLIFIWLPPATYPQFHGMFTYTSTKKVTICRLKKYFFFRRSLSQRFFNAIIQEISTRQNKYIQGIEILTNKHDYSKIYEGIGWKMKSIDGADKIRIRYSRVDL